MNFSALGNLIGFPTDYLSFSDFILKIWDWLLITVFVIWGLNLFMSLIRKAVLILGGVRGE